LQGTNQGANAGRVAFFWQNPSPIFPGATSTTDLDDTLNAWYHIVAVWEDTDGDTGDNGVRSIYINGVLEGTESTAQPRNDVGGNTAIGRAGSFDNQNFNFDGQIDDVAFFNYPLNSEEARWLRNNSLNSIPEPASFGLLALGGLLLGGRRAWRGIAEA
ncbi:MAG: LamG domain-containing protein, partial [Actinobacteria bacterium]|nr:LamG domain-containing protein [Actinomycetota bacterium]